MHAGVRKVPRLNSTRLKRGGTQAGHEAEENWTEPSRLDPSPARASVTSELLMSTDKKKGGKDMSSKNERERNGGKERRSPNYGENDWMWKG